MSTLNVSNISDGSTSVGTSYVVNGSAKVWVNYNGTGTPSIRDSLNASSLTDYGSGLQKVNFTNSMANSSYGFSLMSVVGLSGYLGSQYVPFTSSVASSSFESYAGTSQDSSGNVTFTDSPVVGVTTHGDLA